MHAVIEAKPEEVQLIDLGSGTFVNGSQINKCALVGGEEIRIGNSRLVISIGEAVDASTVVTAPAASVPVAAVTSAVPVAAAMVAPFAVPASPPSVSAVSFIHILRRRRIKQSRSTRS